MINGKTKINEYKISATLLKKRKWGEIREEKAHQNEYKENIHSRNMYLI